MWMGITSSNFELRYIHTRPMICKSFLLTFSPNSIFLLKNLSIINVASKWVFIMFLPRTLKTCIIQSIIFALFATVIPWKVMNSEFSLEDSLAGLEYFIDKGLYFSYIYIESSWVDYDILELSNLYFKFVFIQSIVLE